MRTRDITVLLLRFFMGKKADDGTIRITYCWNSTILEDSCLVPKKIKDMDH